MLVVPDPFGVPDATELHAWAIFEEMHRELNLGASMRDGEIRKAQCRRGLKRAFRAPGEHDHIGRQEMHKISPFYGRQCIRRNRLEI